MSDYKPTLKSQFIKQKDVPQDYQKLQEMHDATAINKKLELEAKREKAK